MRIVAILSLLITSIFSSVLNFNDIKADFIQTIKSKNTKVEYEGKFYATNKNLALWEYTSPSSKRIYFGNKKAIIIEDELEQAIITNLETVPNITNILASSKQISEKLYKAEFDDTEYLITLDKHNLPQIIDYKDKLDNKIKITLKNVKKNIKIDYNIFMPNIPSNYDVITK